MAAAKLNALKVRHPALSFCFDFSLTFSLTFDRRAPPPPPPAQLDDQVRAHVFITSFSALELTPFPGCVARPPSARRPSQNLSMFCTTCLQPIKVKYISQRFKDGGST